MPQQPTLRLGSRGSAVVTLQQRLAALHYFDVVTADGVFGQDTYHAVIASHVSIRRRVLRSFRR